MENIANAKIVGWGPGFYCHLSLVQGGGGLLSPQSWIAGGHFGFAEFSLFWGGSLGWLAFEWFDLGGFLFAMVLQLSWEGCFGTELTCCSL